MRSIRLAVLASIRHSGWTPWLLVAGWGAFAALQEPLLFRAYGIRLPLHAAWGASLSMVFVLLASAPSPRSTASQVLLPQYLVLICAVANAAILGVLATARGDRAGIAAAAGWAAVFWLVATPCTIALATSRSLPTIRRWLLRVLAVGLTIPLAVRFEVEPWSFRPFAATLCAWAAALGFACRSSSAHAYRHPR